MTSAPLNKNAAVVYIILGYPVAAALLSFVMDNRKSIALLQSADLMAFLAVLGIGLLQSVLISAGWALIVGAVIVWLARKQNWTSIRIVVFSALASLLVGALLFATMWYWSEGRLHGASYVLIGFCALSGCVGLLGGLGLVRPTPKEHQK